MTKERALQFRMYIIIILCIEIIQIKLECNYVIFFCKLFLCVQWCVCLFCLSSSCVLCTQCCQFLWIVYSAFSNVYLFCLSSSCVLCTQCCQFLWIVYSVFSIVYFYSPYLISFISAIYLFVLVFEKMNVCHNKQ